MRSPRFHSSLDALAAQLNASIDFDVRLLPFDVEGSKAHARMLSKQQIISIADADAIVRGLDEVQAAFASGEFKMDPALEDVHMNVEKRLADRIGEPAGRLHTARSRNDQVATDLRLFVRAHGHAILEALTGLRGALITQAKAHVDTICPGYTHLQRAQPVRFAHHLLAYHEMLLRDEGRIIDALKRANQNPLGSGALAATTFPIDRDATTRALGFDSPTRNSLDAVGDRDFAIELTSACALILVHLSRLSEELVLWAAQEFQFVKLPEGYCSGSSIMPQKVNPDIPELVRAKSGRVFGDLIALLTVLKGLPLAYNKDLQETQEPLYDAVETTHLSLRVMTGLIAGATFDRERMRRANSEGHLLATEVADFLAERGLAFRQAHAAAGAIVRRAIDRNVEIAALSLDELKSAAGDAARFLDASIFAVLDPERAIDRRDVPGGPARSRVMSAITAAESTLTR